MKILHRTTKEEISEDDAIAIATNCFPLDANVTVHPSITVSIDFDEKDVDVHDLIAYSRTLLSNCC